MEPFGAGRDFLLLGEKKIERRLKEVRGLLWLLCLGVLKARSSFLNVLVQDEDNFHAAPNAPSLSGN